MGRKNWMFCSTELAAKHIGVSQSLLVTCRLHDVDPYDYFVDVLQRIHSHPPSQIDELTPRRWKELFAKDLIRSILHQINEGKKSATKHRRQTALNYRTDVRSQHQLYGISL